jgi:hypothetical protein
MLAAVVAAIPTKTAANGVLYAAANPAAVPASHEDAHARQRLSKQSRNGRTKRPSEFDEWPFASNGHPRRDCYP